MPYSDDNQYFEPPDGAYIEYLNPIKESLLPLIVFNFYPSDFRHNNMFQELSVSNSSGNHDISILELDDAVNYGDYVRISSHGSVKFIISAKVNNLEKWKRVSVYNTSAELLTNISLTFESSAGAVLFNIANNTDLEDYDLETPEIIFTIHNNSGNEEDIVFHTEFLQKGYNTYIDVNNIYNYGMYLNTVFNQLNNNLIAAGSNYIHKNIKINNKSLDNNITLYSEDIGAYPKPLTDSVTAYHSISVLDKDNEEIIVTSGVPYNQSDKILIPPLQAPSNHNIVKINSLISPNQDIKVLRYSHYKNNIYFLLQGRVIDDTLDISLNASYNYYEV